MTYGWFALLPLAATIIALNWACGEEFTKGDYNFGLVFSLPMAAFVSAFAWGAYFAVGWALQ